MQTGRPGRWRLSTFRRGSYNGGQMTSEGIDNTSLISESPRRVWLGWLGVFVSFALLYGITAQRGPAWQDSGIFQWRILRFDLFGSLGLALSHPLLILLGRAVGYVPGGDPAWRFNLISAMAGAVAAAAVAAAAVPPAAATPVAAAVAATLKK